MGSEQERPLLESVRLLRNQAKDELLRADGDADMAALYDRVADLALAADRGDMERVRRIINGDEEASSND